MTKNTSYNLFFCLDENYLPSLYWAFKTFIKFNDPQIFKIHFVVTLDKLTLSEFKKKILTTMEDISPNFNIVIKQFIPPDNLVSTLLKYTKILKKHIKTRAKQNEGNANQDKMHIFYNMGNWSRFYISTMFPDVKIGLYLDLDILFKGSIKEIFDTKLKGHILAAYCVGGDREDITGYNCGVMLFNFDEYRKHKILSKVIDLLNTAIKDKDHFFRGTQGVQNKIITDYVHLPKKYNFIFNHKIHTDRSSHKFEVVDTIDEGIIIHFKGKYPHWSYDKYIHLYYHIMKM